MCRFCGVLPQKTLLLHSNVLYLHFDLSCFCLNCTSALRHIAAHRSFNSCPRTQAAPVRSRASAHRSLLCSWIFFMQQPCQNPQTNGRPGVVWTDDGDPATLCMCSPDFLGCPHIGGYSDFPHFCQFNRHLLNPCMVYFY